MNKTALGKLALPWLLPGRGGKGGISGRYSEDAGGDLGTLGAPGWVAGSRASLFEILGRGPDPGKLGRKYVQVPPQPPARYFSWSVRARICAQAPSCCLIYVPCPSTGWKIKQRL